jgi:hypothetical protein
MSRAILQPRRTTERLHAAHRREHREHLEWRADLERWRREYIQAVLEYVRCTAPELETLSYEAALDAHEVAIDAHEEMLRRHERMLAAEERGGPATSDEMAGFQTEVDGRHSRSRKEHRLLEITHRAILQALRMLGGESPRSSRAGG